MNRSMNEHHSRINKRILEAITKCQAGRMRLEDLENIIANQLSSIDSTYPKALREKLDNFVVSVFNIKTEFLDEPNEDEMVEMVFNEMKSTIQQNL